MPSGPTFPQYAAPNIHLDNADPGLGPLVEDFGRLGLRTSEQPQTLRDVKGGSLDAKTSTGTGLGSKVAGQFAQHYDDGAFFYSSSPQYNYQHYDQNHLTVPFASQYQQIGYSQMHPNGAINGPHTPRGQNWFPSQNVPPVPDLMAHRRSSWSSNEETSPQTPLFGAWQAPVYVVNRSPTSWSTPSPMSAGVAHFHHFARLDDGKPVIADFWEWTQREPAIPTPVPARHSGPDGGRGSLDKILDNPDGTTNVYVRGLQPDTTDELLGLYGSRFGEIDTQKAIIDHASGHCKG